MVSFLNEMLQRPRQTTDQSALQSGYGDLSLEHHRIIFDLLNLDRMAPPDRKIHAFPKNRYWHRGNRRNNRMTRKEFPATTCRQVLILDGAPGPNCKSAGCPSGLSGAMVLEKIRR